VIRFEDVVVRYPGSAAPAVNGVSFDVPRSAVTALAGPNGSGKSSLVAALLRRRPLSGGRITVDGARIDDVERRDFARQVSVITQREEPAFALPVREYIGLGRYPHRSLWRSAAIVDTSAIEKAVALAEVGELVDRTTDQLSGGEWQRVRLARALAQGGDAIVLDEPSTFLDMSHEMAAFELMAKLAREGRAVLLVTHQLNLAARFADTIVVLHHGKVAAHGSADTVMRGDVLERVYEWPLVITRDPAIGAPAVFPLRRGR
jgi:iron complex transport system ATP-binding protein